MEANELMIGDWVGRVFDDKRIIEDYRQVDWIRSGEIGMRYQKVWSIGCIEPIPITAEIFKKNGFVESEVERTEFSDIGIRYTYETQDGSYVIIDWQDSFDNGCGNELHQGWSELWLICISSFCGTYESNPRQKIDVHELQHALRLCGLYELADNFIV